MLKLKIYFCFLVFNCFFCIYKDQLNGDMDPQFRIGKNNLIHLIHLENALVIILVRFRNNYFIFQEYSDDGILV